MKLQTSLVAMGLALVFGIAVGMMISDGPEAPAAKPQTPEIEQPTPAPEIAAENADAGRQAALSIGELNRLLQNEVRARQALQRKLEVLEHQVAALDRDRMLGTSQEAVEQESGDADHIGRRGQGWFDQQTLLDSGMDSSLVSELKSTFERLEMERLYLRDRAAREGWDREQMRNQMQLLESTEDELRERLGESAYDAYLYASGQTNRVAVRSVLESAQAGQAGIKPGDHIIRYDSQHIYNWMELRAATTSGNIGDSVEVEVERDGETLQFYLVRGPLGIRMDALRVAP
ncbi:MAG: PDZ domain-containing protein [Gammaproteobacteria bacterium]|nr:PDZ domain-containing protein [Gammaproteobacteria bacterium]